MVTSAYYSWSLLYMADWVLLKKSLRLQAAHVHVYGLSLDVCLWICGWLCPLLSLLSLSLCIYMHCIGSACILCEHDWAVMWVHAETLPRQGWKLHLRLLALWKRQHVREAPCSSPGSSRPWKRAGDSERTRGKYMVGGHSWDRKICGKIRS